MRKRILWYHPDLKQTARELRNNPTEAEQLLWKKLKGKQVKGYDFHRQKPIQYYIIDFYCVELFLAIEIDGSVHRQDDVKNRDLLRQSELEELGIHFLRFTNKEIFSSIDRVVEVIEEWIDRNA